MEGGVGGAPKRSFAIPIGEPRLGRSANGSMRGRPIDTSRDILRVEKHRGGILVPVYLPRVGAIFWAKSFSAAATASGLLKVA